MKLVNKLSAKAILENVNEVVRDMEIGERKLAYSVVGICDAYEQGASHLGEWTRFIGDLKAINYITGEEFRAPKGHIPTVLEVALLKGIGENTGAKVKDGKGITTAKLNSNIEFAYKVSIERKANGDDGGMNYEYITEPLTEVAVNDNLSRLSKLLDAPPPETEPEPEPEPESVKGKGKGKGK